jgi:hypothetical protein
MSTINLLETKNIVTATVYDRVKQSDVSVNPFAANKTWTFYSGSVTSSAMPLQAIYTETLPPIGSTVPFINATNIDGSYQVITYYSINHLFYKNKTQPYNCFGQTDITRTKKVLYDSASVFSIPQVKVGEGIKRGSFQLDTEINDTIHGTSIPVTKSIAIRSDVYGNLYDSLYDTGSIVNGVMYYEGFNEYFDESRITYTSAGVSYIPGIIATTGATQSLGLAAKFNANGYIETDIVGYYDRDNDYAVSLFISASNTGSTDQLIIAKAASENQTQYPFKLELSGSNQIIASVRGTSNYVTQITSSATVTDWTHVLCQKTGSVFELYIDGTIQASASSNLLNSNIINSFTESAYINNNDALKIAGYSPNSSNLTGVLDEIRIFNHSLTTANISALSDRNEDTLGCIQTNYVGNIFEPQGLAVISSLDYAYEYILNSPFTASYKSTVTIYEMNVITRVNRGSMNISSNPTILKDDNVQVKTFATASDFNPYITTIGLYNDRNELIAIAKLAQPIQKRDDIDINFLVRIDLDKNLPPKP